MRRCCFAPLVPLAVVTAVSAALVPAAEAKFRVSLSVVPARPVAGSPARVVIRTGIVLRRDHGIRLYAVGPLRKWTGQASFEVRLVRTGPRTLTGRVRFRHPGRWHLSLPTPGVSPHFGRAVTVRPRRA